MGLIYILSARAARVIEKSCTIRLHDIKLPVATIVVRFSIHVSNTRQSQTSCRLDLHDTTHVSLILVKSTRMRCHVKSCNSYTIVLLVVDFQEIKKYLAIYLIMDPHRKSCTCS